MKSISHKPIWLFVGAFVILVGLLLGGFVYLNDSDQVVLSGTSGSVQVMAAKVAVPAGGDVTGSLSVVKVELPGATASQYLTPANEGHYLGDVSKAALSAGDLVAISDLETPVATSTAKVPVTFKTAPPLVAGDDVDVYVVEPGTGSSTTLTLLLSDVLLEDGSGSSWVISVPASIAPDLLYVAASYPLDALQVSGATEGANTAISSVSQALQAIEAGSHAAP